MEQRDRGSVKRLTDPRALRALAHPIRMSLVGMLRVHGPLTATRAAELLGESSASCSFHLRQLAKYDRSWPSASITSTVRSLARPGPHIQ